MNANNKVEAFVMKNQQNIGKNINLQNQKCSILETNDEDIKLAAKLIREGQLVAFPTETVYGLGANALNPVAVRSIFDAKKRPLTDPVIVHVCNVQQALEYVELEECLKEMFYLLTDKLWPGPLTIILRANFKKLDRILTAQTDFVGIRCPNNQVALKLIQEAQVPIAAPSANLFSHVSPTNPVHVFNDFYDQNIHIIDSESSVFGVESTVIKLLPKEIQILRFGSISEQQIRQVIDLKFTDIKIGKLDKKVTEFEKQEAPGQLLKHYSPNLDCYLLDLLPENYDEQNLIEVRNVDIQSTVILDFQNQLISLKQFVLKYQLLSETNNLKEVMNRLYDLLRQSENLEGAKVLFIYDVISYFKIQIDKPEFLNTVYDKIYRSTSGRKLYLNQKNLKIYRQIQ